MVLNPSISYFIKLSLLFLRSLLLGWKKVEEAGTEKGQLKASVLAMEKKVLLTLEKKNPDKLNTNSLEYKFKQLLFK